MSNVCYGFEVIEVGISFVKLVGVNFVILLSIEIISKVILVG